MSLRKSLLPPQGLPVTCVATWRISPLACAAAATGELAITAPCLGLSQRLLNRDHASMYYAGMPELGGGR